MSELPKLFSWCLFGDKQTPVFLFLVKHLSVSYFTQRFVVWINLTNLNYDSLMLDSVKALLFVCCSQMTQIHLTLGQLHTLPPRSCLPPICLQQCLLLSLRTAGLSCEYSMIILIRDTCMLLHILQLRVVVQLFTENKNITCDLLYNTVKHIFFMYNEMLSIYFCLLLWVHFDCFGKGRLFIK